MPGPLSGWARGNVDPASLFSHPPTALAPGPAGGLGHHGLCRYGHALGLPLRLPGPAHRELCVLSGTVCVEMCIIPCIYLCTKEKRKKGAIVLAVFSLWRGWGLGPGRRGPQLLQEHAWWKRRSGESCVHASPALLPGAQPWLTGSPSMNGFPSDLQRHQRLGC